MLQFGPLRVCRTILVNSGGLKKESHKYSRVSLHEAPTKNKLCVYQKNKELRRCYLFMRRKQPVFDNQMKQTMNSKKGRTSHVRVKRLTSIEIQLFKGPKSKSLNF